jgi:hypothetical protein
MSSTQPESQDSDPSDFRAVARHRDDPTIFTPILPLNQLIGAAEKHIPIRDVFLVTEDSEGNVIFRRAGYLGLEFFPAQPSAALPSEPTTPEEAAEETEAQRANGQDEGKSFFGRIVG